jgi:hypothetical protein
MVEVRLKSPEISAKKLLEKVRGARGFYLHGAMNPKISPTDAAIAQKETLKRKMADPKVWDKWAENRKAAGDETWLAGIVMKGADRLIPGVEAGIGKWYDFATQFFPYMAPAVAEVKKMPKVTIDDSVRRAEKIIRHNYNFRFKRKAYTKSDLESLREKIDTVALPG